MRVYRPPQFNDVCRIWLRAFPPSLADWDGFPPARTPDLETPCQVYRPRESYSRLLHAMVDDAVETFGHAGDMELRLPKGTEVYTVWGISRSQNYSGGALVEWPVASGRLYVLTLVETKHRNFPNEYVVGVLAQLRNAGAARPMAAGSAMSAETSSGIGESPISFGMTVASETWLPDADWIVTPPDYLPSIVWPFGVRPSMGMGAAVASLLEVNLINRRLPIGTAILAKWSGLKGESKLAIGGALEAELQLPVEPHDLGIGTAATATYSTAAGGAIGGMSCASATAVPVNSSSTVAVLSGATKWLRCPIPSGTYKVTLTLISGSHGTAVAMFGTCPSPGSWGSVSSNGTTCVSSALAAGNLFVTVTGGAGGTGTFNVKVETGTC